MLVLALLAALLALLALALLALVLLALVALAPSATATGLLKVIAPPLLVTLFCKIVRVLLLKLTVLVELIKRFTVISLKP